ncbi:CidB/LrgB family autolysis modulator [Paenibacillus crassostreae]|uniref:CidB/LrgB family autolysis modulator n=1 Tax=Paenibacillus crassostreae TaxID=1763538 RepID=A0A167BHQ2_9BACL|nr:CidB/LrgB family autolysis modulator [Paenibacillus crassostreae]AOZ94711.1 CidB/LrgB family autolysis modulator [Paenibacillus crassostreae]OAB72076.1 CidB/LrgB family autolysis modulator [Paenibacillus crassostreae]
MTGILYLILTLTIYYTAKFIYKKWTKVFLSPLLITPLALVLLLLWGGVPYETYNMGGQWLSDLLQPATVAFAVPLYKHFKVLKKHAVEIIASVLFGSIVAMITSVVLGKWMHLNSSLVTSLMPRSITTPIAINVSEVIGGVPNITAVFVIITGLLGTIIGPSVLKIFHIDNEVARGILLGTSAHGMGTSKAFELSKLSGTISSISMILAALFTLGMAPYMMSILLQY